MAAHSAPEEESMHLVTERGAALRTDVQAVGRSSFFSGRRDLSSYGVPLVGVTVFVGMSCCLVALWANAGSLCSGSHGLTARLLCHGTKSSRGRPLRFLEDEREGQQVEEFDGAAMHSSDAVLCSPSSPLTGDDWAARVWEVDDGMKMACQARNRLKDGWKVRFTTQERNWCWVGVKDICHRSIHRPMNWAEYRKEAYRQELSPSPLDAPFSGLDNPELCDQPDLGLPDPYTSEEEHKAAKWFNEHVKVYVVNLPKYVERWKMVSSRLAELGINATRVSGVDMEVPGMLDKAKAAGWVPKSFNFSKAQNTAYGPRLQEGSVLGTVGCASAHFKVQQQMIKDGSLLGLVLEDDSYLIDGFVVHLWRIVTTELPCDWDILQLLARCPYGKCISKHLARIQPDGNEPEWRCRAGVNWGMHGMLYRISNLPAVQEIWKKTVFNELSPHCLDVDIALASISDRVGYYAIPNSQTPGLVKEMPLGSARYAINVATQR
eukprot:TRINITY_DN3762_c0_g3_i1.p1 TRINITY_DN3762_c0_g3~~TRINITY_DN3762_c0_g3_i1.p1  ORF type:complete len:491 (-),score=80.05 TRINITY_DN3762_c0_g3_i1:28-1500(-)